MSFFLHTQYDKKVSTLPRSRYKNSTFGGLLTESHAKTLHQTGTRGASAVQRWGGGEQVCSESLYVPNAL